MSFTAPEIIKNDVEVFSESQDKRAKVEFLMKLEINDSFVVESYDAADIMRLADTLGITLKSKDIFFENPIIIKVKFKRVA